MIYYDIANDFLKEFPNTIFKILPLEMVALILKKKNELNFNVRFKNYLASKKIKCLLQHFVDSDRSLQIVRFTTARKIIVVHSNAEDRRNTIRFYDRRIYEVLGQVPRPMPPCLT